MLGLATSTMQKVCNGSAIRAQPLKTTYGQNN